MLELIRFKIVATVFFIVFSALIIIGFNVYFEDYILTSKYQRQVAHAHSLGMDVDVKSSNITEKDIEQIKKDINNEEQFIKYNNYLVKNIAENDLSRITFLDMNTSKHLSQEGDDVFLANDLSSVIIIAKYAYLIDLGKINYNSNIYYSPSSDYDVDSVIITSIDNFEYASIDQLLNYVINDNDQVAINMLYNNLSYEQHTQLENKLFDNKLNYDNNNLYLTTNQITLLFNFIYENKDLKYIDQYLKMHKHFEDRNIYLFEINNQLSITISDEKNKYIYTIFNQYGHIDDQPALKYGRSLEE